MIVSLIMRFWFIWISTGKICPEDFVYRFGTCSKKMEKDETQTCKEATMGTGKSFKLPHVIIFFNWNFIHLIFLTCIKHFNIFWCKIELFLLLGSKMGNCKRRHFIWCMVLLMPRRIYLFWRVVLFFEKCIWLCWSRLLVVECYNG